MKEISEERTRVDLIAILNSSIGASFAWQAGLLFSFVINCIQVAVMGKIRHSFGNRGE
jgi:hypothetical protein